MGLRQATASLCGVAMDSGWVQCIYKFNSDEVGK